MMENSISRIVYQLRSAGKKRKKTKESYTFVCLWLMMVILCVYVWMYMCVCLSEDYERVPCLMILTKKDDEEDVTEGFI